MVSDFIGLLKVLTVEKIHGRAQVSACLIGINDHL
jgi:hypothetical protein